MKCNQNGLSNIFELFKHLNNSNIANTYKITQYIIIWNHLQHFLVQIIQIIPTNL